MEQTMPAQARSLAGQPTGWPDDRKIGLVIGRWAGGAGKTVIALHVEQPWMLEWQASMSLRVTVTRNSGTASSSITQSQVSAGSGTAAMSGGGDFALEFSASGPWSARAVRVGGP